MYIVPFLVKLLCLKNLQNLGETFLLLRFLTHGSFILFSNGFPFLYKLELSVCLVFVI